MEKTRGKLGSKKKESKSATVAAYVHFENEK